MGNTIFADIQQTRRPLIPKLKLFGNLMFAHDYKWLHLQNN